MVGGAGGRGNGVGRRGGDVVQGVEDGGDGGGADLELATEWKAEAKGVDDFFEDAVERVDVAAGGR